jgi:hypothetical protein
MKNTLLHRETWRQHLKGRQFFFERETAGEGHELHCKKVTDFPVFSRDVTYQTLPGRE